MVPRVFLQRTSKQAWRRFWKSGGRNSPGKLCNTRTVFLIFASHSVGVAIA